MSNAPDQQPSVPLREHLEGKIQGLREHMDLRFDEQARALSVSTTKLEHDFENVNELRKQVEEERGMFPRKELLEALERRVGKIESVAETNRLALETLPTRLARLERLLPFVSLGSAVGGSLATTLALKLFGIGFK